MFQTPIMTHVYLLIAAAFLARAGLYFYYALIYRDRDSDMPLAAVSTLLAFSFALYGLEHLWPTAIIIERVLDLVICALVITSFIKSILSEVRRGRRLGKRRNRGK